MTSPVNRPRLWASLFYLFYFAAFGSLAPYLNIIYRDRGVEPIWIGVLAAIQTVIPLFAGPLWGIVADKFQLYSSLLPISMALTLPGIGILMQAQDLWLLIAGVILYAVCLAPIVPLADFKVLSMLGEERYDYGKIRIWGAFGYAVVAWLVGVLMERIGAQIAFYFAFVLMLSGALIAFRLPSPAARSTPASWLKLLRFSTDLRWLRFLAGVLLAGVSTSVILNYYGLYLIDLGGGEGLVGLSMAVAGISEITVFYLSARLLRLWKPRGVLSFSMIALAIRNLYYSLVGRPDLALVGQLLHGPTFSALWSSGVNYSMEVAPPELGASAQAIYGGVYFGLAGGIGALIGGKLYGSTGPATLFQIAALVALLGFLLIGTARSEAAQSSQA